jgi:phosphoenolpyruvate carboxylase
VADAHAARGEARRARRDRERARYFSYTFIDTIPAILADVEDSIASLPGKAPRREMSPLMAVGSWVGGDRDGNPS